jgi:hypothetical protein
MAYDGWIEFNGTELVNVARTTQLAEALGIDSVWVESSSVDWIQAALGGVDYDLVTTAPWYDPAYPASGEFAGLLPLGFPGLDDSTLTSSAVEYITDGGNPGRARNSTLSIVASVAIVASTSRGAEFGKRWMDRVLRAGGPGAFCAGFDLRYFRWDSSDSPFAHRRNVKTTRGASVTRKRIRDCSATWMSTFTLTAGDPYEYGDPIPQVADLGEDTGPTGPTVNDSGVVTMFEQTCPTYDYTPVYDPNHPALVPSPTAPDFYPDGWTIQDGDQFHRFWARLDPLSPVSLAVVPVFSLESATDARMVRVSIWEWSDFDVQCDPLFTATITYIPVTTGFIIDGEQQASYIWDGVSPVVRRTDSLVYGSDASPVDWTSFSAPGDLLVTLDVFTEEEIEDVSVRASVTFVPKSD